MKTKPILFSAPMINALLDGRKTQTRRIINPDKVFRDLRPYTEGRFNERGNFEYRGGPRHTGLIGLSDPNIAKQYCPYVDCDSYDAPIDSLLYVKESIKRGYNGDMDRSHYAADDSQTDADAWPWKLKTLPAMFCPLGLSRLTLRITDVRVERLREISEEDAIAEGVFKKTGTSPIGDVVETCGGGELIYAAPHQAREEYSFLWEVINGDGSWAANPWVWCISFDVIRANVDSIK